jgi:acetyl esterase/lipase
MPLPRCRPGFSDHIFKTAAGVQLPLRVWPPAKPKGASAANGNSSEGKGGAPWLLWIHGGMFWGLSRRDHVLWASICSATN